MFFTEIFQRAEKVLSLEFFPPKKAEMLDSTIEQISSFKRVMPHFMTVTYGAGGGTRELTKRLVLHIAKGLGIPAVAHLTCVGHAVDELEQILESFEREQLFNLLALRGDPPSGQSEFVQTEGGLSCARDLVELIAKKGCFNVAVAGYPEVHREAQSRSADLDYLKKKVDAGAELIITQLFFDNDYYYRFVEDAQRAGIGVPIQPGIMPIGNLAQIKRFTEMCGATLPWGLVRELDKYADAPDALTDFGTEYAICQCSQLLKNGAPGLHLYTLNKSNQVLPIVQELTRSHVLGRGEQCAEQCSSAIQ